MRTSRWYSRRRARATALPPALAVRARDYPRGRARAQLRRPRDRRGVRGRGPRAAARALAEPAPLLGRQPAAVWLLARAARSEGPQRLPALRAAPPRGRALIPAEPCAAGRQPRWPPRSR